MFRQTHKILQKTLVNLQNELKSEEFISIIKKIESKDAKTCKGINRLHGECASLYRSILSIKKAILDGKLNVENPYSESDLKMISVINHIHYEFGKAGHYKQELSPLHAIDELLEINDQLRALTTFFPEDLGANFKKAPNIITNIKLDLYQMIYLYVVNARSLIHEIKLQKEIYKMVYLETVDLSL